MAFTEVRSQITPTVVKTGAASTPVGGTDDLLTTGNTVKFTPRIAKGRLDTHSASFTKRKGFVGARQWDVGCQFYWQGSGALGTVAVNGFASIDALMRACAMTRNAVESTSIAYAPSTIAALEACTFWAEQDGQLHKAANTIGNMVMEGNPEDGLLCTFSGVGTYAEPTLATISGFTGGTVRAQPFLNIGLTITPAGGSAYTPVVASLRWDRGIELGRIMDSNQSTGFLRALVRDARPTLRLSIAADKDGASSLTYPNLYANLVASTTHAVTLTHGSTTGNATELSAAEAELTNINRTPGDGYDILDLDYDLTHTSNEGEFGFLIAA